MKTTRENPLTLIHEVNFMPEIEFRKGITLYCYDPGFQFGRKTMIQTISSGEIIISGSLLSDLSKWNTTKRRIQWDFTFVTKGASYKLWVWLVFFTCTWARVWVFLGQRRKQIDVVWGTWPWCFPATKRKKTRSLEHLYLEYSVIEQNVYLVLRKNFSFQLKIRVGKSIEMLSCSPKIGYVHAAAPCLHEKKESKFFLLRSPANKSLCEVMIVPFFTHFPFAFWSIVDTQCHISFMCTI